MTARCKQLLKANAKLEKEIRDRDTVIRLLEIAEVVPEGTASKFLQFVQTGQLRKPSGDLMRFDHEKDYGHDAD